MNPLVAVSSRSILVFLGIFLFIASALEFFIFDSCGAVQDLNRLALAFALNW